MSISAEAELPTRRALFRRLVTALALLPFKASAVICALIYMVATTPILFVCIVGILGPAEIAWILSPFVGLVSPKAGKWLSGRMEVAGDLLCGGIMDRVWAPLGWSFDFVDWMPSFATIERG